MTITKEFATKTVGLAVAAAMFFSVAMPAQAQTAEELQAMINSLLAQIAALQAGGTTGTTTTTGFQWTRDLRLGSTGADVLELQKFLNQDADTRVAATGAGSLGNETSYYGPATAAAVSKFQVKYRADVLTPGGLVNPTGYFGSASRAKANALNTSSTTGGNTGGDTVLKGGEADVSPKLLTSGNISIDYGKADTPIEVELDVRDGDIELNRVDFTFDARPWLFFDEVNLLVDGKEVGSLSKESDYNEVTAGTKYRARFSNTKTVIRKGDKATVALEVVVVGSMSSSRATQYNGGIKVDIDDSSIRYTDAAGITTTDGVTATATISGTASSYGSLEASVAANSPRNNSVILDNDTVTKNEEVAIARLKAKTNDVTVRSIDVELKLNGSASDVKGAVTRVRAFDGTTEIGSTAVSNTGNLATTTISDLSLRVREGRTADIRFEVDLVKGSALPVGSTDVEVTNITFNYENADYAESAKTVTFNEKHSLVNGGLSAKISKISHNSSDDGKTVTFNFEMDITANDGDFTIPQNASTVTVDGVTGSSSVALSSDASQVGANFVVYDGQTRRFTVTKVFAGGAAAFVQSTVNSIGSLVLGAPEYQSAKVWKN